MNDTILVIEDDPDTAEMLRVYFETQDYQVELAFTGGEGLKKCSEIRPNLILLDVRLPDMDGFEVGKQLQNDVSTSRLPVIFLTERRGRDDRISGLKLGAIDYVTKPFDVQELRLRVRNALRRVGSQNNPITGLPGETITTNRLTAILERQQWSVLGIKVNGLAKFNEIYGFVARDDVLRAVALTITSAVDELGSMDDFIGHPSESQFVILTTPKKIAQLQSSIENRLNQAMVYFYPILDRQAGFVELGEDGRRESIPFMNVWTVVISSKNHSGSTIDFIQQVLDGKTKL